MEKLDLQTALGYGVNMTPQEEKEWEEECQKFLEAKGYVPAEILMLPMLLGLAEEGLLDIHSDDEHTIITNVSYNKFVNKQKNKG